MAVMSALLANGCAFSLLRIVNELSPNGPNGKSPGSDHVCRQPGPPPIDFVLQSTLLFAQPEPGGRVSAPDASAIAAPPAPRIGIAVLGSSLALGLAGDLLLRGAPLGLNLPLAIAALVITAHLVSQRTDGALRWADPWLLTAIGFASCFAVRNAEALQFLNAWAIVVALGLGGLSHFVEPHLGRLRDYLAGGLRTGTFAVGGGLVLLNDAEWGTLKSRGHVRRIGPIVLGLCLALPIFAVFGGIFASADPAFEEMAKALLTGWDPGPVITHGMTTLAFGWLAAGLLRAWLWRPADLWRARPLDGLAAHARAAIGPVPIGIAVGALLLVFLLFVVVQARTLFGGDALVQTVTGLSYAEYARRGFFEMVAASALAIPVLYGADAMLDGARREAVRNVRTLGVVQLALVGLTMASAANRMRLYIDAYGLTTDRILVAAIIAWLAFVLVWFGATVLRGRRGRFTFGATTSGFAVLAALNAVNPDALIVRVNTGRAATVAVDGKYLQRLSADAIPILVARLDKLPADEACRLSNDVRNRWVNESRGWRGWNLATTRATRAARRLRIDTRCPAVVAAPVTGSATR